MCVASSHSNFGCGVVCSAPNGARCHAILHQLYPSSPSCSVLTPMPLHGLAPHSAGSLAVPERAACRGCCAQVETCG